MKNSPQACPPINKFTRPIFGDFFCDRKTKKATSCCWVCHGRLFFFFFFFFPEIALCRRFHGQARDLIKARLIQLSVGSN